MTEHNSDPMQSDAYIEFLYSELNEAEAAYDEVAKQLDGCREHEIDALETELKEIGEWVHYLRQMLEKEMNG